MWKFRNIVTFFQFISQDSEMWFWPHETPAQKSYSASERDKQQDYVI